MKPSRISLLVALFAAGAVQAQLLDPSPATVLRADAPALRIAPSFPHVYAGSQGLPPADPQALDIFRADPKLYAGVDFNSVLGIETSFTNPGYQDGMMRHQGSGPRLAQGMQLGVGGFDFDTVARMTVPIDDRLSVFGKLGVAVRAREHHRMGSAYSSTTTTVGTIASVGATYKLNSRQTATAEVPLGAIARKALTGSAGALGGSVSLGF